MTIAIGVLASDGIVLAADTEHTYFGGEIKSSGSKMIAGHPLHFTGSVSPVVALAGAGYTNYIKSIQLPLLNDTFPLLDQPDFATLEGAIEQRLHDFYSAHVLPFWQSNDRTVEFDLLVAIRAAQQNIAFATDKTSVRPVIGFECIGVGSAYAVMILNNLYTPNMKTSSAVLMACHVIHNVKEVVQGCGKKTEILCITDGRITPFTDNVVDQMESFLMGYSRLRAVSLQSVFGASGTLDDSSKMMRSLHEDGEYLLRNIQAMIDGRSTGP